MKSEALSTRVQTTRSGHGLFSLHNFEEDTIVDKFQGEVVAYSKIPADQITDAYEIDDNRWIVPRNHARYINHSCDPNCYLSQALDLVSLRRIQKGEELTIMYNEVTVDKYMKSGYKLPQWDQRRSFECQCGSYKCIGRIDRYIVNNPEDPNCRNIKMAAILGQGRGILARHKILKGELIERAPVIVVPDKQWPNVADSILSDYAFDWGVKDEHAAIALGYVSIYNHSYSPNAKLEELLDELAMEIIALRNIEADEEITINYNGDPKSRKALWFNSGPPKRRATKKLR
jgi:uncharacterized protein